MRCGPLDALILLLSEHLVCTKPASAAPETRNTPRYGPKVREAILV
jgi:hypothetical protein